MSPGWFANGPGVFRRVGDVLLDRSTQAAAPIESLVVLEDAFEQADAEVARLLRVGYSRAWRMTCRRLAATASLPAAWTPGARCFRIIQAGEIWSNYGEFVARRQPQFGPGIRERMEFAATVSEREVETRAGAARCSSRPDPRDGTAGTVLALPTAPCIAPRVDAPMDELESFRVRVMRLTCIAGLGGLPQVTLPIGSVAGFPVGLSFIGWAGGDETLLALCVALSRHCGAAG